MRAMAFRRISMLGALVGALVASAPAQAVVGGAADEGAHPAVAGIVSERDDGLVGCTGTLVAPRVVLTAGHCVEGAHWVKVSFDEQPQFTPEPRQPVGPGWVDGTPRLHPGYDWPANDIAVIELPAAVAGIEPMPLAGAGTIDRMNEPQRRNAIWTAVGYGGYYEKDGRPQFAFPFVRRVGTVQYVRTATERPAGDAGANFFNNDGQLMMQNTVDEGHAGDGSICFGDSGGPLSLDGHVVAELSGPFNGAPCFGGFTYYFRTDTANARGFLAQYGVALP